jgi:hypothetical protein
LYNGSAVNDRSPVNVKWREKLREELQRQWKASRLYADFKRNQRWGATFRCGKMTEELWKERRMASKAIWQNFFHPDEVQFVKFLWVIVREVLCVPRGRKIAEDIKARWYVYVGVIVVAMLLAVRAFGDVIPWI